MVEVKIKDRNSFDKALLKFSKKVKDAGIIYELQRRSYYEKKSDVKRHKKSAAKLRNKYALLNNIESWCFSVY